MLFNSPEFLFLFLPAACLLFYCARRLSPATQLVTIIGLSLFFYGYWRIEYLPVLIFSLTSNCVIAHMINRSRTEATRKAWFILGVTVALSFLGFYKYTHFIMENLSLVFGFDYTGTPGEIPIGISFYTFTAIAFLSDIHTRRITEYTVTEYGATITYFPHLVAGPILFHHDTMPQLRDPDGIRLDWNKIMLFLFFFSLGLLKKTGLADNVAKIADPIFAQVANGGIPDPGQAWRAALGYSFQLYYDFSGYSDMAIGLGCLFGIRVPVNFYSPYKSRNITEFWQRWHVSLGYFLRTYLYIPLGGNRKGRTRTLINLFIVFFLCGIWHGAGWTFVAWGAMHGAAMIVHRLFASTVSLPKNRATTMAATLFTFLFVVFAWVLFRADSFHTASVIMQSMVGLSADRLHNLPNNNVEIYLGLLMLVTWLMPNTIQIMQRFSPAILHGRAVEWPFVHCIPTSLKEGTLFGYATGAFTAAALVTGAIFMFVNGQVRYLYFDF
ncbi:MBOAT family O-acyltransferase [Pseudodesulfovibrio sediminis]|uniref:Alginate O-acetylation protein n=1 Tax=Pseudodesulfovibrio sediminis TaxID=2810563 RepID=A0ABN6EV47_9BACT|nr:MBOAT family O-acyltransferase [Pseudodesulfovibrio sediminis]BCS89090.1 alginate O-acetylation protein [Pseudodesulfovibrio sediminis]